MLNYEITRVRYDARRHCIDRFELRPFGGGARTDENRMTIIARIASGSRFRTAPATGAGADVIAVNHGPTQYLKTVRDNLPGDNLGALPEF